MADTKISALTALVAGDIQHTSDVVAIVDTSVTTTKKATAQAVVNAVLAQNTDTTVTGTINQTTIPTSKTLLVSTDIGSTVQGYDAQLADVAGLAVTDGNFIVGNGTNFVAESGSTARTSLGLGTGDSPEFTAVNIGSATDTTVTRVSAGVIAVEGSNVLLASNIGTSVQAYDAQLADVAGLTPTDNGVIIGNGANFVVESGATLKTSLGLTIGTDVQAYDADTAKLDVAQTFTAAQTFNNPTVFSAGTASLPSITFSGDTNTGIFSPAADTIAFAEGGVEAMRIDSDGDVGIGTSSPTARLQVSRAGGSAGSGNLVYVDVTSSFGGISVNSTANNNTFIELLEAGTKVGGFDADTTNNITAVQAAGSHVLAFNTGGTTERMRIDSSGNVGIGTTSPGTSNTAGASFVPGTSTVASMTGSNGSGQLLLGNNGNGSNLAANDNCGAIIFKGRFNGTFGGGNDVASILGTYTGNGTTRSGAIRFLTLDSGTEAERARITSGGYFKASSTGSYISSTGAYHEFRTDNSGLFVSTANASQTSDNIVSRSVRGANSAYRFFSGESSDGGDPEFNLRGDGNGYADGTWNNNGADYAEFFESANGEALTLGATVVLDGNKVREATDQDSATSIIGVVRPKEPSKASMVVGNTAWNKWANKYLTDDFDRYIMEDHDVVEWEETITDEEGKTSTKQHSYESNNIPAGITVPADATIKTHDDKGNKFQHYKLNPAWDKEAEYVNRENRPEWNIIGMLGQVKILKGQPVSDRWIKMRDVSAIVEEWMIR